MDTEAVSTRAAGSSRASAAFLAVGLVGTAVVALGEDPLRGWVFLALMVSAACCGVVAVRRDPSPSNPAWWVLAGAVLLVPAYLLWYPGALRWGLQLGSPSVTDWLFLGGYACFLVALGRLLRTRGAGDRRVHVLDSLIIGVGLLVVVWVAFIAPYLRDDALSWPARLVAISYTVVDLLLFGAIARVLVQGRVASTGHRLLTAWIGAQLVADLVYSVTTLQGTFELSGVTPVLYAASFVLLGAALLHPSTTSHSLAEADLPPSSSARWLVLVAPATLLAPVVLIVLGLQGSSEEVPVVAALSGVLFALVLLRVWLLMVDVREHRRIQDRLTTSIEMERHRAAENQELLASLRERQMLSDRLFRIQRKISTRVPLQEVLDSITQGAAELLRDDVIGLRLLDRDDPTTMVMVSSVGVPPDMAAALHRLPVSEGVGGRALTEDRVCIQEAYEDWDGAIGAFASTGLRSAMGAPVHLEARSIGSLVVASHDAGRHYSVAEQDALMAFAEHVSLALNDASTVQAMHEALDQAVHQAMHDELTGLPNRACFYDRTEQALRLARRDSSQTAVLLFDLDRFKEINDTLGHRYGDRVLRAIGPRIQPLLREPDTLARLGGDEFCILLPRVTSEAAAVEVARRITTALEEPFEVDGMNMVVEASCGVSVAPAHGDTADLLLQRADVAMYVSKTSHVSVVAYEPRLDRNTPDRLSLLADLRSAIGADQLVVHYQPQADLATGEVVGVEALVRWQHPRLGLVGPDQFVPMAEDTGLIRALTSWVLTASLADLRCWLDDESFAAPRLSLAVNLSTRSLLDESIREEVVAALRCHDIPADRLVLEVTETTLMADPARAHRLLTDLAAVGVRFAIDDFGTGYSSLASLKTLPVHHLKIDKSFVANMHQDNNDATIVRSVIDLGHTLGLRTVAEGVEGPEAWAQLRELGCDLAQGYLLARPMPAAELRGWLEEHRRERLTVVAG
jgi:diguanylate cyclase (GGDEF)-like protein